MWIVLSEHTERLVFSFSVKRVKEDFQGKSHIFLAVFWEAPQVNGTKNQSESYEE